MRPSTAFALSALLGLSVTNAVARDAEADCQVLTQIVDDAKNSFLNVRRDSEANDMGSAKTYPASVEFADSQWCSVVISTSFFNENYSCDLRNTSVEDAATFVGQCLGETALPDPDYQLDHFKVFRLTSEGAGSVHIYQAGFVDLVKITVNAEEPR